MFDAFHGVVVGVAEPDFPVFAEGFFVDSEAMVLAGDVAAASFGVDTWLVLAAVTELEFVSLCAGSESHYLGAETDAKDRFLEFHGFADVFVEFGEHRWVTRSV